MMVYSHLVPNANLTLAETRSSNLKPNPDPCQSPNPNPNTDPNSNLTSSNEMSCGRVDCHP